MFYDTPNLRRLVECRSKQAIEIMVQIMPFSGGEYKFLSYALEPSPSHFHSLFRDLAISGWPGIGSQGCGDKRLELPALLTHRMHNDMGKIPQGCA
jgi:hypothetical protein